MPYALDFQEDSQEGKHEESAVYRKLNLFALILVQVLIMHADCK